MDATYNRPLTRQREPHAGRPPKDPSAVRFYDRALHTLLVQRLAHVDGVVRGGRIDPKILALRSGFARYTVYRWLNGDRLSIKAANALIRVSSGTITREDLTYFILD